MTTIDHAQQTESGRIRWLNIVCYALLLLLFTPSCRHPNVRENPVGAAGADTSVSREELLSGKVEKTWVNVREKESFEQRKESKAKPDVRFIFYRNYTLTTFGSYGTRQGHWSLDDPHMLSFHFEAPDTVQRFEILHLDSAMLRLRVHGDELLYKPE